MGLERANRSEGLIDAAVAGLGGPRTAAMLDRLSVSVDGADLASPVRALPAYTHSGAGRRPWDAVLMIKCLVLAKLFGLSDPQLEELLQDRLSFRRFVGLSLDDATPDETTFVRFRARLREADLDVALFERALAQLDAKGLVLREGTRVDATIMEAPRPRKVVEIDAEGTTTTRTIRDEDASFTRKHGRTYHGYKMHLGTDTRGLIKKVEADTAKVHDSRHFASLIEDELRGTDPRGQPSRGSGGGGAVLADAAYASAAATALLDARGVHDGTIKRRVRGQDALPWWQQQINRANAKVRAIVEHPIAWIKQQMGHRRVRYRGLRRNALDFRLIALAYNLKRSLSLTPR